MTATTPETQSQLRVRVLHAPEPWEAGLLPVSGFPLPRDERESLRAVLGRICGLAGAANSELLLLLDELHHDGGARLLSDKAPAWTPRLGLAIRPDREPPRDHQMSDFLKLKPNMKPERLVSRFARPALQGRELDEARDLMFGRGAVVQIGTGEPVQKLGERCDARLSRDITDPAYRSADFYRPLLGAKALEAVSGPELDELLGGARFYLRESAEDKGVLIVTRGPLKALLEPLGGQLRDGERPVWRIPDAPSA